MYLQVVGAKNRDVILTHPSCWYHHNCHFPPMLWIACWAQTGFQWKYCCCSIIRNDRSQPKKKPTVWFRSSNPWWWKSCDARGLLQFTFTFGWTLFHTPGNDDETADRECANREVNTKRGRLLPRGNSILLKFQSNRLSVPKPYEVATQFIHWIIILCSSILISNHPLTFIPI